MLAFAIAIAFYLDTPLAKTGFDIDQKRMLRKAGLWAFSIVTIAFLAALQKKGLQSTIADFLQYRTRDDSMAYGSHWQFHE